MSSSSFAFIPRKVAKKSATSLKVNAISEDSPRPSSSQPPKGKQPAQEPESDPTRLSAEECVILVSLAFSEYALWSDVDLRKKLTPVEFSSRVIALPNAPLSSSLAVTRDPTHSNPPQPWFNRTGAASNTQSAGGGYEVRLKSWDPNSSNLSSKSEWDKRTIYVENVPIHYRSVAALVQFVLALLPSKESLSSSPARVQHVFLPPHHRDKPGDVPIFKGFSLITFSDEADPKHFVEAWPWQPREDSPSKSSANNDETTSDAVKYGFRTTSKSNWEALRAEYLVYRQQLVQEINDHQDASALTRVHQKEPSSHEGQTSSSAKPSKQPKEDEDVSTTNNSAITFDSPYPYGCLVFVKNIHPETNKTTLKTLFGKALSQSDAAVNGGIDYVDFNKGMDTCYLRLSTPDCAHYLASYYNDHQTVEANGLDDTGTPHSPDSSQKPISIEIVPGTREEVYWQKVPEKIRRSAVEKAVQLQGGAGGAPPTKTPLEDSRPKKRRKR
ncbi:hypothetical protein EST38_g1653 [Candolleomyces aberdarensis]|uniref:XRRM domain-containing protein n=1 Tax=Candolleomyces aberdarensis TaxID=2316362 RepID=A0A4Q2DVH1_9AGAR|nr:hypothetical protein EST38_g1653 [Candolleomyces aberdarensis]